MKSLQSFLYTLFILFPLLTTGKGYNIEIKFPENISSSIYLANYYGDKVMVVDSVVLDKNNSGSFRGDSLLHEGIYMLASPKKRYFDLMIGSDQSFTIDASNSYELDNLKITGSGISQQFLLFQKEMKRLKDKQIAARNYLKNNPANADSIQLYKRILNELDTEVNNFWEREVEKNKGTFYGKFVKSMTETKIPPSGISSNQTDYQMLQWKYEYNWRKNHFLDNIDFTDDRFIRTPVFHQKISFYFNNLLLQIPDSVNIQVDRVLSRASENSNMHRFLAHFLLTNFSESKVMGMDASFVHVAENYFLNGKVAIDSLMYGQLYRETLLLKPTLIGGTARDLVMEDPEGIHHSLHQVNADYTVVIFWEPNCGHCKVQIPQLYKEVFIPMQNKGVNVFAVYTKNDKEKWISFIQEHGLFDWINVYDPEHLTYFRNFYKIESTPAIYILDKKKKIVAKNIDIPTVGRWLKNHIK